MGVGYEKIAVFDQYLASSRRAVNSATIRCCRQSVATPWQVGGTHSLQGSIKRRYLLIAEDGRQSATH